MKKACIIGFMIALSAIAVGLIIIYTIIYIPSGIDIDKIKYPITGIDVDEQTEIVKAIEEEMQLVNANKRLVEIFEQKIKTKIGEVWGVKEEVETV